MIQSNLIMTYGLTDEQITKVQANIPVKSCEVVNTDCASDIIATNEMAVIIVCEKLSDDDIKILYEFYKEIAPFPETIIFLGKPDFLGDILKYVSVYGSFEELEQNLKYILLSAYRKNKKTVNFSITIANTLLVLSEIRKHPCITTGQLSEKLELSNRTIQRYIETLRMAGEWIEYNYQHKGWELQVGKSILWGDFDT